MLVVGHGANLLLLEGRGAQFVEHALTMAAFVIYGIFSIWHWAEFVELGVTRLRL